MISYLKGNMQNPNIFKSLPLLCAYKSVSMLAFKSQTHPNPKKRQHCQHFLFRPLDDVQLEHSLIHISINLFTKVDDTFFLLILLHPYEENEMTLRIHLEADKCFKKYFCVTAESHIGSTLSVCLYFF